MESKKIIGRKEIISILDLELYNLDAKVDTGADSNALHCDHIDVDEQNNTVSSPQGGMIHTIKALGDTVEKGEIIACIDDPFEDN